jgi:hypothetical protein
MRATYHVLDGSARNSCATRSTICREPKSCRIVVKGHSWSMSAWEGWEKEGVERLKED